MPGSESANIRHADPKDPEPIPVRRRPGRAYDIKLLFPVLVLLGIGLVMVYSSSSALALKKFGSDHYFLKRQVAFALVGICMLVVCRWLSIDRLKKLTYPMLLLAVMLLIAVKIPGCGYTAGGATRWVKIAGFTFQPVEFARFALIVYLAYSLSRKQERLAEFSIGFMPHAIVLGLLTILVMSQPDFGSAVILCALTWIMMFVGGVRVKHLMLTVAGLMPLIYFFLVRAEYRLQRIISFLDPWKYAADGGYQIIHSLMAFGTGGISGTGLGKGYQKLFYLPEPHTDFIFSVIGEELGFLGILVILGLYVLILVKGTQIAMRADSLFTRFLAMGITTALGLQVCINMGVTLGMLPTKGLTLPFISYGGTSLLCNMACIGFLMNIGSVEKT